MTTEDELALWLAKDLDEAFPQFVAAYERTVYSIALRLCGERESALELSAETFHRAYRALRDYDAKRTAQLELRPWTVTIVINLCRNWSRSRARRPIEVPLHEARSMMSKVETPERALERNEDERQLVTTLARLSDPQRSAVVLHYVIGLPYEEIATALSCPLGTAKSHGARGIQRLRELLVATTAKEK